MDNMKKISLVIFNRRLNLIIVVPIKRLNPITTKTRFSDHITYHIKMLFSTYIHSIETEHRTCKGREGDIKLDSVQNMHKNQLKELIWRDAPKI